MLLADEMGLGKTLQALAICGFYREWPLLVVSPASLTNQWANEIAKWLPYLNSNLTNHHSNHDSTHHINGGKIHGKYPQYHRHRHDDHEEEGGYNGGGGYGDRIFVVSTNQDCEISTDLLIPSTPNPSSLSNSQPSAGFNNDIAGSENRRVQVVIVSYDLVGPLCLAHNFYSEIPTRKVVNKNKNNHNHHENHENNENNENH